MLLNWTFRFYIKSRPHADSPSNTATLANDLRRNLTDVAITSTQRTEYEDESDHCRSTESASSVVALPNRL